MQQDHDKTRSHLLQIGGGQHEKLQSGIFRGKVGEHHAAGNQHIEHRQNQTVTRSGKSEHVFQHFQRNVRGIDQLPIDADKTKEITQENAKHGGKVTIQSDVKAQELCEPLKTELFHFEEN